MRLELLFVVAMRGRVILTLRGVSAGLLLCLCFPTVVNC
jgi:hypothetical protein